VQQTAPFPAQRMLLVKRFAKCGELVQDALDACNLFICNANKDDNWSVLSTQVIERMVLRLIAVTQTLAAFHGTANFVPQWNREELEFAIADKATLLVHALFRKASSAFIEMRKSTPLIKFHKSAKAVKVFQMANKCFRVRAKLEDAELDRFTEAQEALAESVQTMKEQLRQGFNSASNGTERAGKWASPQTVALTRGSRSSSRSNPDQKQQQKTLGGAFRSSSSATSAKMHALLRTTTPSPSDLLELTKLLNDPAQPAFSFEALSGFARTAMASHNLNGVKALLFASKRNCDDSSSSLPYDVRCNEWLHEAVLKNFIACIEYFVPTTTTTTTATLASSCDAKTS
jgi:hypothetical protein